MTKNIVITNIVCILALGLILVMTKFFPLFIVIPIGVLWFIYVIYANYYIIVKSNDVITMLKSANKRGYFNSCIYDIKKQVNSIESRREVFENLEEGDKLKEVYNLVEKQFYVNVDYIIKYMSSFDYVSKPRSHEDKITTLVAQNNVLISKLNDLVQQMIDVDKSVDNIDTSLLDDIINSLRSMSDE